MELLGQEPGKIYGTVHWEENGRHLSSGGNYILPGESGSPTISISSPSSGVLTP